MPNQMPARPVAGPVRGNHITVSWNKHRSVDAVMAEAERRGIDLARRFTMEYHEALTYAEFWQE